MGGNIDEVVIVQKENIQVAIVFPGQGSQYPGMGKEFYDTFDVAKKIFDCAEEVIGEGFKKLCFEGSEDELTLTYNAQPAILTHSIAVFYSIRERLNFYPRFFAGHSLGEYSAIVASGGLRFEDALKLVRSRGLYMQSAVPPSEGAMAAIIGLDVEKIKDVIEKVKGSDVLEIANHNSPEQVVISGRASAVERSLEELKKNGAKRCIRLNVSAPFHCSLMKPAADKLCEDLKQVHFNELSVPVVTNVGGEIITESERFRVLLAEQVVKPVQWVDCVLTMVKEGITRFIEMGPGRVLSGLIKRLDKNLIVVNIEKPEDIETAFRNLGESNE